MTYNDFYNQTYTDLKQAYEIYPAVEILIDNIAHNTAVLKLSRISKNENDLLSVDEYTKLEKTLNKHIEILEKTASKRAVEHDQEAKKVLALAKAIQGIEDVVRRKRLIKEASRIYPGMGEILDELGNARLTDIAEYKRSKERRAAKSSRTVKKDRTKRGGKVSSAKS